MLALPHRLTEPVSLTRVLMRDGGTRNAVDLVISWPINKSMCGECASG